MTAPGDAPEAGAGPIDGLERILEGDGLLQALFSAPRPAGRGNAYVSGLYLADVLKGLAPGGILLACTGDTSEWSRGFAHATGRKEIPLKRRAGVFFLPSPPRCPYGERGVTVVPLAPGGIEEHLARAGLTAAAMAFDIGPFPRGGLIDPFGARADLARGVMKTVPGSFSGASVLLPLNAVEVCCRYGLDMEEETVAALKEAAGRTAGFPPEAAWAAMARLAGGRGLSDAAVLLARTGVIEALVPELAAVFRVPQNYYHHLGVWEHTLETLYHLESMLADPAAFFKPYGVRIEAHLMQPVEGGVSRRAFLAFAALVHDIGKASVMEVENTGRVRFQGHQVEGARMARRLASRLGLGYRGRRYIESVVGGHMRLGFLIRDGETVESRLRAVSELGSLCLDIAMLSMADRLATRGEASTEEALERFRRLVNRFVSDYFWDRYSPRLVRGREVIVHSGVEPGAEVARRLFAVRVAQRESNVDTPQQALEFLAPDFKGRMR